MSQSSKIVTCLQQGGAVVARLRYDWWHYVLLTGADSRWIYMLTPIIKKRVFKAMT